MNVEFEMKLDKMLKEEEAIFFVAVRPLLVTAETRRLKR